MYRTFSHVSGKHCLPKFHSVIIRAVSIVSRYYSKLDSFPYSFLYVQMSKWESPKAHADKISPKRLR